jgi:hypothetical protein
MRRVETQLSAPNIKSVRKSKQYSSKKPYENINIIDMRMSMRR